ncbi:MAG TPA: hypothetical protein VMV43_00995 [Candidatus Nanopelagicaceae bacterium]|nr:hypothetical protein [Candidatus Nanopelagicaceae bacterium]
MEDKKKKFLYSVLTINLALIVAFVLLFSLYGPILAATIFDNDIGLIAITSRIVILGIMSFFLYRKWLKQEAIYISDAYFLFGSFFGIFTWAKVYDVFYNSAVISGLFDTGFILMLVKIRFFIIIANLMPILYIGLDAILVYINMNKNKEMKKKQFNKLRLRIILIFVLITISVIVLAPSLDFLNLVFPFMTIVSFIAIAFMFLFMYKNKRLSQANGLIIGIAFICFIASNLLRTILISTNLYFSTIAEIIDIGVNLLMFIGFITKPKYAR